MSRHMLLMIVCCAVPLALVFVLPYLGVSLSSRPIDMRHGEGFSIGFWEPVPPAFSLRSCIRC